MAKKKKKKPVRYPWHQWFKRNKFELVKGIHFARGIEPYVMAQQVRSYAHRQRYRVSIQIFGSQRLEVTVTRRP